MYTLKIPATKPSINIEAHKRWMNLLKEADIILEADTDMQYKVSKGLRLKDRRLAPEVLGRLYAQYCTLINKMYEIYLKNMQLQRAPYISEIVNVFMKRIYELRRELVLYIVNDYIYVDGALILVPHHLPLDARPQEREEMYETMVKESIRRQKMAEWRKGRPARPDAEPQLNYGDDEEGFSSNPTATATTEPTQDDDDEEYESIPESVPTQTPEEYIHSTMLQKHERFRRFYREDFNKKAAERKKYFTGKIVEPSKAMKKRGTRAIQKYYREYIRLKREHVQDCKRDLLLGIMSDIDRRPLDLAEETLKLNEYRCAKRQKLKNSYEKDYTKQSTKWIRINRGNQMDDITDQIHEWFFEWYYGYGFFPQYPYEAENGTVLVIRGQYPSIEEQEEEDEAFIKANKGKTKEQLKQEKDQAKLDAQMKAEAEADRKKKEAEQLFKARCNPPADPGYEPKQSEATGIMIETLKKYRLAWSMFDEFPIERCKDVVYGYMIPMLDEDIMEGMHWECRKIVDELMRLEVKIFIKAQKKMYDRVNWPWPKQRPRKRPKLPPPPKPLIIDSKVMSNLEKVLDLNITFRSKAKFRDIVGDFNYAAYDYNITDPIATFPPPGYGDIRRRLSLSCVFGAGLESSATKNKAVMLVGQPRNGKSFLIDCCVGEMNAIKFDISPEKFSKATKRPAKMLPYVFLAARVFQPCVIYLRDVEKVFYKKVPPSERKFKATALKGPLTKLVKALPPTDKVILLATCTSPWLAKVRPMVKMFSQVILVPRPDYGSVEQYLYNKLQSIRSMPRNYGVHSLAYIMSGVGFGLIMEIYNKVLTSERIVKLNVKPLDPSEFLEYMIENDIERISLDEYKISYIDFVLKNSELKAIREEYNVINSVRKIVYDKLELKRKQDEEKAEAAKAKN